MSNNVAFVLISTGPFSRTYKAEVCLESMYKISKYKGKAFLITDSPECYDQHHLQELCATNNIQIVPVPKFSDKLDFPLTLQWKGKRVRYPVIRTLTPTKRYKSKSLKAEIFNLIQDKEVDILIYIDSDVVFMQKEGLDDLLHIAAKDWVEEEIRIRVREWNNDEQIFNANCSIHGGFFIAHRYYSKRALEHWGRIMSQKKYWIENVTDKEKFLRAYREAEQHGDPNYMKVNPLPGGVEVIIDPYNKNGLIGHITHGRIKKHGKKVIENFISQFNLKSFPKGYYTLPGLPMWLDDLIFLGYPGYKGNYKIEDRWKKIRSFFVREEKQE